MKEEPLRVGLTADFEVSAKGLWEETVEAKFRGAGIAWEVLPARGEDAPKPEDLNRVDAVLALRIKITSEALRGVERTAVIARWGVGYDSIDTEAMTQANVALAITPNAVRRPVAEGILTLILAVSKNLRRKDQVIRSGGWIKDIGRLGVCIGGRTLGSLGCGNIGRELFRLAGSLGFGRMIAHDPYADPDAMRAAGIEPVSMEELFRKSDYVTVNTLLNASTRGLVREEHFRLMKPDAYFINTSRGPIIDEAALIKALSENWIVGAGIDVFEQEPVDRSNPLLAMENVILSPHAIAWTEDLGRDNTGEACDNILELFNGRAPHGIVNQEVFDRPRFQEKLARLSRLSPDVHIGVGPPT